MQRETPLEIAKKRYAKGEITREELDNIKQNL
ncbi:MAG: SHOCT domain-containing protein [Pseudomonadota bacterium]